jgi:hypothetical protein
MVKIYWWEYDIYIGIIGVLLILFFGVYLRFKHNFINGEYTFKQLDIPLLIMFLLSLGYIYKFVFQLHLPFLIAERVSLRFMIIPVTMLIIISCIRMQKILEKYRGKKLIRSIIFIGVLYLAYLLGEHSMAWRITAIEKNFNYGITNLNINLIYKEDYYYKLLEVISMLISVTIMCIIVYSLTIKKAFNKKNLIIRR